jgi:hypothetical protein
LVNFVTLGILALLLWLAPPISGHKPRRCRAIRAMRDDPVAARVAGIDLAHYTAVIYRGGVRPTPASPARVRAGLLPRLRRARELHYWLLEFSCWWARYSAGWTSGWGAVIGGTSSCSFWPRHRGHGIFPRTWVYPVFGALLVLSMEAHAGRRRRRSGAAWAGRAGDG